MVKVYIVYTYTRWDEDKEIVGAFTNIGAATHLAQELNKDRDVSAYVFAATLDENAV